MATSILVVAEAPADWRMVTKLIDRKVLHHAPDWLRDEPGNLEAHRVWRGFEADAQFTSFAQLKKVAMDKYESALRGAGPLGFSSSARGYEWASMRKVLILASFGPTPDVVVYSRDMDRQPRERKASIEAAIAASPNLPFVVVPALANAKREAWILNGFISKNASEAKRLTALRKELKFDPCERAEELDSSARGAVKDAKRVLRKLTGDNPDRELECLEAPWKILRQRGRGTGLAEFLEHVKERIVPLVPGC